MILKLKNSLAYRLPHFYRAILKQKPFKAQPKQTFPLSVVMMTGKHHLDYLQLSIISISKNWSKVPQLTVINDGSLKNDEIKRKLAFWQGDLIVEDWDNTKHFYQLQGRLALLRYAELNPFGKKLAVILRFAAKNPIIWIDSDILFFNDFTPHIPQPTTEFALGGMCDWRAAYDNRLLKTFGNDLYQKENFNAGLLFASGDTILRRL
ncbi:hypothetical protein [Pedobacter sp. MW01-1-1]|uniref:hypothetical protein n=1 Tax=Pedobacter sp. MW01-1-1 TaxID=3383027 RepID=UPI003FED613D